MGDVGRCEYRILLSVDGIIVLLYVPPPDRSPGLRGNVPRDSGIDSVGVIILNPGPILLVIGERIDILHEHGGSSQDTKMEKSPDGVRIEIIDFIPTASVILELMTIP
jgi:hypothetical protein